MDTLLDGRGSSEQPPLETKHHHVGDNGDNSRLRQFYELAAERSRTDVFPIRPPSSHVSPPSPA